MLLKPKEYHLCDDKDYNKKIGIIAQDVDIVEVDFAELIYTTDSEYIANIYSSSGNYDTWDKWDKLGWIRINRISRIRLGYPHGTYPEKGVLILNTYPTGISYRIS